MPATRPLEHMRNVAEKYPQAWKIFEQSRLVKGIRFPDWPDWCFVPITGALNVATMGQVFRTPVPIEEQARISRDAGALAALGAWRMTRGVYQFDPSLFEELWNTPVGDDIPTDILYHLPEWCPYIPIPALQLSLGTATVTLHGSFVNLDWNSQTNQMSFWLMLDLDGPDGNPALHPVPILGRNIKDGLHAIAKNIQAKGHHIPAKDGNPLDDMDNVAAVASKVLSLVLYLCSEKPDVTGKAEPGNPKPTKTKRGPRLFPADNDRLWSVGQRIGPTLRKTTSSTREHNQEGPSAGNVRPHIRRAHWHLYWTGPKSAPQKPLLKWVHATLVAENNAEEELPATIRPVTSS